MTTVQISAGNTMARGGPSVLVAEGVEVRTRRGVRLLDDISITLRSGEIVAVVGASGSGKTTLLQTLAGLRSPSRGTLRLREPSIAVGYVPQDDIVHGELTVSETVRFAARLRFGTSMDREALSRAVLDVVADLGLADRSAVVVSSLSGGQRKRVSIATELVGRPVVCFLDEPTSGLDPGAAAALMGTLATLARQGTTIVFTTHRHADLTVADRVVEVVAGGGIAERRGAANSGEGRRWAEPSAPTEEADSGSALRAGPRDRPLRPRLPRQVVTLAHRTLVVLGRNRLSVAIMAGSPVAVVAMLAVLFRPGTIGSTADDPVLASALAYWLAFAGFFFGLTFGLLQICSEAAMVRRELRAAVGADAYLVSKFVVLLPVLMVVDASMVTALSSMGRIEGLTALRLLGLSVVLAADSLAGLAIGLAASAAVTSPTQATLALPMLCFPAVLFGGGLVAVDTMTVVGRIHASVVSTRWAFDAVTHVVGAGSGLSVPLFALGVITALATATTRVVLVRRGRPST